MMKKFAKLYGKSSTGKLLEWQIIAEEDYFYTVAGQIEGKKVTSAPNKCVGKNVGRSNETTPEKQAIAEAEAKWKKKIKEGYRENVEDVDNVEFREPMLAKIFKDRLDKVKYPVLVDHKLNGNRLLTTAKGQTTRKGEPYFAIPHLFEILKPLFDKYPNLYLDGEAYNHDYRYELNELNKLIRKTKNVTVEDLEKSCKLVYYYVYDGYGWDNVTESTNQFERRTKLVELLKDIPHIVPVIGEVAETEEQVWKIYQKYVEEEYEGAIVRLEGPYEHKRSSLLLKVKPEDDAEGIILDIMTGDGNWDKAGKIIRLKWNNIEFNASFKGSYEDAVTFLKDKKKWIGREVTFLYNNLTGLGVPNFARVDYKNCLKK